LQVKKETYEDFPYDTNDTYDFLLRMGPVDNLDKLYFKGRIPLFTSLMEHPNHDSFYTDQNWQKALGKTTVPTLNVA
ncbi:hypothetical protein ABTK75_20430, partial [Acinetobacter baumannii]